MPLYRSGYSTSPGAGAEKADKVVNAGWQPDPTGRHGLRYHDGELWTAHVADGPMQSLDPMTTPMPGPGSWGTSGWAITTAREHPDDTTILVLGILGVTVCGILGPFAWSKGNSALAEMDREPHITWTNRGQIRAGQICGIVSTCLLAFSALMLILFVAVAASSSS